jgi:hypothetical protein
MNAKILARIGIAIVATSATLMPFVASEPVRGQDVANVSSSGPRVSVRVRETASASIRLRQSAAPLPVSPGVEGSGRALASGDFDEDGVPDLVTGYATPQGGVVSVRRGNVDAIYSNSAEAKARRQRGEFTAAAFHSSARSFSVPKAVDFIGAGDFDADGHWDIIAASKGDARFYWLRGDGKGNFGEAQVVELPGAVTALATGEINRVDGLTDIAVGIVAADGARALIFESADGALRGAPETFALSAPVNAFAFGQLDEEAAADLAVASGNEVLVIHGRDRKLSLDAEKQRLVPPAQLSRSAFDAEVLSIAVGDFMGDWKQELAALTVDGSVHLLGRDGVISQSKEASVISPKRLIVAKLSALPKDDLLIFAGANEVHVVTTGVAGKQLSLAATIQGEDEVAAMLPMRLNADALNDLVLLNKTDGTLTVIESQAASVFVVNTTARTTDVNPGDGVCADVDGNCSFAAAIMEANAHAGADTINFNIPGGGVPSVGTHVPSASAVFNAVNEAVTIDGTTQPGGRVEVNSDGFTPLIFYGGNSVLRGVAIYGQNVSLNLASAGNIVEGNYVGFRPDGSKPSYGQIGGIHFRGGVNNSLPGNNNLIGGTVAQARNVISNCDVGLNFSANTGNIVQGNHVGTTIDGTAALPNARTLIAGDSDVVVGGTTSGAGNLFSGANGTGTFSTGLALSKTALIQGNRFGTTADGMQPISNAGYAIEILTNQLVTIGGTTPAARNVISGSLFGIQVDHEQGEATLIQGNYIGTNAEGNGAIPNLIDGVRLTGVRAVTVGGTSSGAGNLISGNGDHGIELAGGINGTPCRGVVIQGNLVGTNATGVVAIPNQKNGIEMPSGLGVLIGGRTAAARNIISGNVGDGVQIQGGDLVNPNRIEGNFIGTNSFGTGALGNRKHGIYFFLNVQGHNIGGPIPEAGNRIAFNLGSGIASERPNLGAAILSNSIFANGALGIDRADNGVTPYGCGFSEAPAINSVETSGSQTTITGSLCTQTADGGKAPYTIQFFSSSSYDPSGYGEGQTLVGQTVIHAGGQTAASFSVTITPAIPPGRYISAVAVGTIDSRTPETLSTSEFSFNARVAGDPAPENTPLRLNVITPSVGGDTGTVTIKIVGEGIRPGATVLLRRAGQTDIIGAVVSISSDGSRLDVSFDLTGRPQGEWGVVVTNPEGTTATLAEAFTIERGRGDQVWADLIGRETIRIGRDAKFYLVYGNRGNIDAPGAIFFITVPRSVTIMPGTEFPRHFMPPGIDTEIPRLVETDEFVVVPFAVPLLAPGETGLATFELNSPAGNFDISLYTLSASSTRVGSGARNQSRPNTQSATGKNRGIQFTVAGIPSQDQVALAEATSVLLETWGHDTFVTNFPFEACVGAAKHRGSALLERATRPGSALQGWTIRVITKNGTGVGHTTNLVTSPDGQRHYLVDNYATPTILQMDAFGSGWVPAGGSVTDLPYLVFEGLINASTLIDGGDLIYSEYPETTPMCYPPNPVKKRPVAPVQSRDPNDKVGSEGVGVQNFSTGEEPMRYAIYFENVETATAPAQDVVISDQLDISKFDLSTFRFGPVTFGKNFGAAPPPGASEWTADVDLRPTKNLVVRVIAGLDQLTGLITWRFFSLDPQTMQPTEDASAGFLPPNKNAPEGDGAVTFTVKAKPSLATGTQIRNKARVVFDNNAPIDTPEWLNTIDNSPPSSQVLALPANNASSRFEVEWAGVDAEAGIGAYTIFVSENGGAFTVWLVNTTETSAFYEGRPNTTYAFYSVAEDRAGNFEAPPGPADAFTAILSGQLLNIATRLRVQTGENVLIGGLIVTGTEAKKVIIRGIGPSLSQFFAGALANPTLDLYQGNTLLASNDDWKDSQRAEIEATTIPPANDFESAIVRTLAPGFYTAILRGKDGGTGIGVVEAYDLDQAANSKLANIATRGFVDSGDNVMIGGVIAGGNGGADTRVLIRAIGPSLTAAGVTGALQDPTLELRDTNGALMRQNDNWQESQQTEIESTRIPPGNAAESAIVATLMPGNYTAIVRGKNNTTGVGLVEVYDLD